MTGQMATSPPHRYSASFLASYGTLAQGQADDLKIDTGRYRWWLSRCGLTDGMEYESTCFIEELVDGRWVTIDTYDGGSVEE